MTTRSGQISSIFLKFSDVFLMSCALALTIVDKYAPPNQGHNAGFLLEFLSNRITVANALLGGLLLFIWHTSFNSKILYTPNRLRMLEAEVKAVGRGVVVSSVALLIIAQLGNWQTINWRVSVSFGLTAVSLIVCARLLINFVLRWLRLRGQNSKSVLVVGGGPRAKRFISEVSDHRELGYTLLGYVESDPEFTHESLVGSPWLGPVEDLPRIIADQVVDEVAIALPVKSHYQQIEQTIGLLEVQGITVHMLSDFFQVHLSRAHAAEFQGIPLVSLHSAPLMDWRTDAKRLIDLVAASVILIVFLPLFALIALAIKLDSTGPIFFIQGRMGLNKRRFRLFKFRTMVIDAEARMKEIEHLNEKDGAIFKIKNDPRITRVGRWLRKTSLDELPQLLNVLFGDMSLVGPRPLSLRDALRLEEAWQKRRFSVKPGITCLWQVSGRSNLSFEQWMHLDLEYIDHWSLGLDCRILLRTIPAVITGEGAV